MFFAPLLMQLAPASSAAQTANFAPIDREEMGMFGVSIAELDDLDGDGTREIAVGDPSDHSGRGVVFVYSGCNGAILCELHASGIGISFGARVSAVPDTDGSGDLIVGSFAGAVDGHSRVWTMSTRDGACVGLDLVQNRTVDQLRGIRDRDGDGCGESAWAVPSFVNIRWSGTPMATANERKPLVPDCTWVEGIYLTPLFAPYPDIDGDGIDEMLVIRSVRDDTGNASIRDRSSTDRSFLVVFQIVSGASEQLLSSCVRDLGGGRVTDVDVLDDYDGDSWPEIVVSRTSSSRNRRGYATLLRGLTFEPLRSFAPLTEDQQLWNSGWSTLAFVSPRRVCGVGDMDGDGKMEIALGYPSESMVYVCSPTTGATWIRVSGPIDVFGEVIERLSDVDGDGVGDFVLGTATLMGFTEMEGAFIHSGRDGSLIRRLRKPAKHSRE